MGPVCLVGHLQPPAKSCWCFTNITWKIVPAPHKRRCCLHFAAGDVKHKEAKVSPGSTVESVQLASPLLFQLLQPATIIPWGYWCWDWWLTPKRFGFTYSWVMLGQAVTLLSLQLPCESFLRVTHGPQFKTSSRWAIPAWVWVFSGLFFSFSIFLLKITSSVTSSQQCPLLDCKPS